MSGQIVCSEKALAIATHRELALRISDLYELPDGTAAEFEAHLSRRFSRYSDAAVIQQYRIKALNPPHGPFHDAPEEMQALYPDESAPRLGVPSPPVEHEQRRQPP